MLTLLRGSVPFNSPSENLGGFIEIIRPCAFNRSLRDGVEVLARTDHDPRLLLGRRSTGSLRLQATDAALEYEVDVPDTTAGRDVAALVERGDYHQSSFTFCIPDPARGERWSIGPGDTLLRELLDVRLVDVSPVCEPAYPAATVSGRNALAAAGQEEIDLLRRRFK